MTTGSSAERAGLSEGDVVVEVNGEVVEREYLKEVVRLIMCGGSSVRMLVVDRTEYKTMRQTHPPHTATVPNNKKVRNSSTFPIRQNVSKSIDHILKLLDCMYQVPESMYGSILLLQISEAVHNSFV